jgi:hypothetical protein
VSADSAGSAARAGETLPRLELGFFFGVQLDFGNPSNPGCVRERERDVYHPDLVELFIDKFSISIHMNKTRDKNR